MVSVIVEPLTQVLPECEVLEYPPAAIIVEVLGFIPLTLPVKVTELAKVFAPVKVCVEARTTSPPPAGAAQVFVPSAVRAEINSPEEQAPGAVAR